MDLPILQVHAMSHAPTYTTCPRNEARTCTDTTGPRNEPYTQCSRGDQEEGGLLSCCLTSTEAGWPIRDGDRVGRGRESEGSTAETVRKRPERPWTAARTMEC